MSRSLLRPLAPWMALSAVLAGLAGPAQALTATPTPTPTRTLVRYMTSTPRPSATPTRHVWPTVTPGPSPTPSLTPGGPNYVVQYGDTLQKIAGRYGLTVSALRAANGIQSDTIYAGQVLFIPTPAPTAAPTALPAGYTRYVVQPGDQLRALARRFGVTVSALRAANNLGSDILPAGRVLAVPPPLPTATALPAGSGYLVQPGDQLLAIARRYGLTASSLRAANNLSTDVLQPGQWLFIPTATPTRTAAPPSATPTGAYVLHVVQTGDRLQRLAVWYGVTVAAIRAANHLAGDTLILGRGLTIPAPTRRPLAYTVQPGDTLTALAARFDTTILDLQISNGMGTGDTILAGLILIVPARP